MLPHGVRSDGTAGLLVFRAICRSGPYACARLCRRASVAPEAGDTARLHKPAVRLGPGRVMAAARRPARPRGQLSL